MVTALNQLLKRGSLKMDEPNCTGWFWVQS